ncbi:MAG: hypothetical protein ACK55I_00300, partial [bacterium]
MVVAPPEPAAPAPPPPPPRLPAAPVPPALPCELTRLAYAVPECVPPLLAPLDRAFPLIPLPPP